jgi:hypothetical protein
MRRFAGERAFSAADGVKRTMFALGRALDCFTRDRSGAGLAQQVGDEVGLVRGIGEAHRAVVYAMAVVGTRQIREPRLGADAGEQVARGLERHVHGAFNPATDRIVNLEAFAAPAPFSFGSAPRAMDELRQFPVLTESLSISKRLPRIGPASIELQGQLMNAFNRVRFANFDPNYSSVNFGKARSTSLPRYLQLVVKVTF